jgi:hypothetical protein
MSLHSDTLFWFQANQSLHLLFYAASNRYQFYSFWLIWQGLGPTIYRTWGEHGWSDRALDPWSTVLEARTVDLTGAWTHDLPYLRWGRLIWQGLGPTIYRTWGEDGWFDRGLDPRSTVLEASTVDLTGAWTHDLPYLSRARLIWQGLGPTIYRTWGEHAIYYTTNVVTLYERKLSMPKAIKMYIIGILFLG